MNDADRRGRQREEEIRGGRVGRRSDRGKGEVLRDKSHLPHCYRSYILRRKTIPVILVYDTYQTIFHTTLSGASPPAK